MVGSAFDILAGPLNEAPVILQYFRFLRLGMDGYRLHHALKLTDLAVLRIVVRSGFSHDKAELFLRDLRAAISRLDELAAHLAVSARVGTPP